MAIGSWNQLIFAHDESKALTIGSVTVAPPSNAIDLRNFAFQVSGWLPKADWKLLQFDNSNSLRAYEDMLLRQVSCTLPDGTFSTHRALLFQFSSDSTSRVAMELMVASLIHYLLLFEAHAYVVSSNCQNGQMLSVHDGAVSFHFPSSSQDLVEEFLQSLQKHPRATPRWITEIDELLSP